VAEPHRPERGAPPVQSSMIQDPLRRHAPIVVVLDALITA
jgi:hypothetical protein